MNEGFRTDLPPAEMGVPPRGAAVPRPKPTRLTTEQILRTEALQAAVRSKPGADPVDQLRLAARYLRWLETGRDDLL